MTKFEKVLPIIMILTAVIIFSLVHYTITNVSNAIEDSGGAKNITISIGKELMDIKDKILEEKLQ